MFAIVAALAFVVGFAVHRGTNCSVIAAAQLARSGRSTRFLSFLVAAAVATALTVPLAWLAPDSVRLYASNGWTLAPAVGGACYGLGALVNGACALGTFARITIGRASFLLTLPGIGLGAQLAMALGLARFRGAPTPPPMASAEPFTGVLLAVAGLVALAGLIASVVAHRRAGATALRLLRARQWRPTFSMVVVGAAAGLLFAIAEPWSWPTLVRGLSGLITGQPVTLATATLVGTAAMFAGGLVAGSLSGHLRWRGFELRQSARSLAGGTIMGASAALVPGGNDVLLLYGLPGLAASAVIAYLAMSAVLLAILSIYYRALAPSRPA
jgi:hypothetical protein